MCHRSVSIISQGEIVAESLSSYLQRHPEIEQHCSKNGRIELYTSDSPKEFDNHTTNFFGTQLKSSHVLID